MPLCTSSMGCSRRDQDRGGGGTMMGKLRRVDLREVSQHETLGSTS
jgi:hypothetical protein